jgi:hypothetical protein
MGEMSSLQIRMNLPILSTTGEFLNHSSGNEGVGVRRNHNIPLSFWVPTIT